MAVTTGPLVSGTLTSVNITPDGAILVPGGVQNFTAVPACSGGPCPGGIQFTWSLSKPLATLNTSQGAEVLLTAGPSNGSASLVVNASYGTTNVTSPPVDIQIDWSLGVITSVRISPAFVSVAAGASQTFSAILTCENNNCPLSIYTRYSWNLTPNLGRLDGAASSAYFTAGASGGNATLLVVVSANGITKNATARVEVLPLTQHLNSVMVEPYELTLMTGQHAGFQASTNCTGGPCPLSLLSFNWSLSNTLGSITLLTGTGTSFVAGAAPGEDFLSVNATLNGSEVQSLPVPITIVSSALPQLLSLSIAPSATTLLQGGVQDLEATPVCSTVCPSGIPIVWGGYGIPGSVGSLNTSNGADVAFTAGSLTGQFNLFATAYLGNTSVENTTLLNLLGPGYAVLTSVRVSPTLATIVPGGTVNLTALPSCQGTYCSGVVEYNWTISGGLGTLSSSNATSVTFTAGASTGSELVTVSAWDEGYSATSAPTTVEISANLVTVTSVRIDPGQSTVATNGAEILTAQPSCTAACPSSIQYVWLLIGTDGHLNKQLDPATSAFDGGGTAGTDEVRVTATLNGSSRVGFANITVGTASTPGGGLSGGGSGGLTVLIAILGSVAAAAVGAVVFVRHRGKRGPGSQLTTPRAPPGQEATSGGDPGDR